MADNSILSEAHTLVHGDRGVDYGHPALDFQRTATIWSAILGIPVEAKQVALCMIGVKISRLVNAPKRDSVVDIAGYAETYQMVVDREAQLATTQNVPAPGSTTQAGAPTA